MKISLEISSRDNYVMISFSEIILRGCLSAIINSMTNSTKNLGDLGEKAAADYLKNKGYKIIERNFKNSAGRRLGEIDIIAMDNQENELVFVEVKTRELDKFKDTLPEENITYPKIRKLAKIASAYLRLRGLEDMNYRFDAISVWLDKNTNQAKIKHIFSL